jgi:hypothetical protein
MKIQWKRAGIGVVMGLALLGMSSLLPGNPRGLVYAQAPQTMTPGEWQALARQVAGRLDQIGRQMGVAPQVRAVYVPAFTQEYLKTFQMLLMQGASKQQADVLATRHIAGLIQQAMAQSGTASSGGYLRRGPFGSTGSDGNCSYYMHPNGSSVMTGNC